MIIFAWLISTLLWVTVWIPFYILGFFVTWIGLLFTTRNSEHMPFPWWFWDSNAGINGTLGYQNLNWVLICNPWLSNSVNPINNAKYLIDSKKGNERTYMNRWLWVTWRNPVTNISRWLIGVSERPFEVEGWEAGPLVYQHISAGFLWSYSFTFKYSDKRGFFFRFGWKFDDVQDGRACFIYRISPYKNIS